MKILKNDEVQVVRGKDKNRHGKVLVVLPKESKVLVEGVNQYKRHKKGRLQGEKSEIATITKPLPVSSVMFVCPKCHKASRIGYVMDGNEKKRQCKKCKAMM